MLYPLWSAKSGVGCTTLALALATSLAATDNPCLLVDLQGDLPAAAGAPAPRFGVTDWLASTSDVDALGQVETELGPNLSLLSLGAARRWDGQRDLLLLQTLRRERRPVVFDLGCLPETELTGLERLRRAVAVEPGSILVTRACYLAMRRIQALSLQPDSVALVREYGRALDRYDIARLLGMPVTAEIDHDPAVARAVDSGTMIRRTPKLLRRQLQPLVRS